MLKNLENAKNLYLRGIRDGEVQEVLDNYMGDTYTQHSTGVKDGKEGFREFFEDFFKRNPKRDIRIVRCLSDGPYVFLHVHQNLNDGAAQWVTTDLFRSDENGRIVEHWDVIDAYQKNENGPDPIFGEFEIQDIEKTEANKNTVRLFLTEVLQNHSMNRFDHYVSDSLIQHDRQLGKTADDWKSFITDHAVAYDFVFKTAGQGDHVVTYSHVLTDGTAYAQFDIFRLQDGKIAEHWSNREPVPARQELVNSGKF